jgi:hypothetical protein
MSKGDYFLDMAINAAIEYVQKKEGIELEGKHRQRYKSIIIDDEEFHVFAFFKYGLLIDYDKDSDELLVNELEGVGVVNMIKKCFLFLNQVLIDLAVWTNSKKHIKNSKMQIIQKKISKK